MAGMKDYVRDKNSENKSNVRSDDEIKRLKEEFHLNPDDPLAQSQQQHSLKENPSTHGKADPDLKGEHGHGSSQADIFGTDAGSLDESMADDESQLEQDRRAQTISSEGPSEADAQFNSDELAHGVQDGHPTLTGDHGVSSQLHKKHPLSKSYPSTSTVASEAEASVLPEIFHPSAIDQIHAGFQFARPAQQQRGTQQYHQQALAPRGAPHPTDMPVRGQGRAGIDRRQQLSGQAPLSSVPVEVTTSSNMQPATFNSIKMPTGTHVFAMDTSNRNLFNTRAPEAQSLSPEDQEESPPAYEASSRGATRVPPHASVVAHTSRQPVMPNPHNVFHEDSDIRTATWRAGSLPTVEGVQASSPTPEQRAQPSRVKVRSKKDKKGQEADERLTPALAPQQQQQQQPSPKQSPSERTLDYDSDDIMKLDYPALRAQPFDFGPADAHAPYPAEEFEELMSKYFNSPPAEQSKFFATMTIDQWEDAGDWLLDRATDIMKRMKAARREKRKLALEIEMEIEKRHNAVVRKRKLTDEVLGAMKRSGGQVLASTPRKRISSEKA